MCNEVNWIFQLLSSKIRVANYATYGEPEYALGSANSTAVSFGDAGETILTFYKSIKDGAGFDLDAVGVINEQVLGIVENQNLVFSIYSNLVFNMLFVEVKRTVKEIVYDL